MTFNPGYTLELPDRQIQLKMDWAAIATAEAEGFDLLNGAFDKATGVAAFLWACGRGDAPDLTKEHWLALLLRHGEACGLAVASLFARYGAPEEAAPAGEAKAADGETAKG